MERKVADTGAKRRAAGQPGAESVVAVGPRVESGWIVAVVALAVALALAVGSEPGAWAAQ